MLAAPKIGYGWAMRVIALISLVAGGIGCILTRTRLPLNKKAGAGVDFRALWKDGHYAATTAAVFLVEFAVFIPITYIASYAIDVGLGQSNSYLMIVVLNAGAVPGRFLPGLLADYLGRFNIMIVTAIVCGVLTLALWSAAHGSFAATIAYAILFGFWSGAAISLTPVCIAQVK